MPADRVLLGVLGRPHGVRGLMHVLSHTDPPEALAEYGVLETADGRRFTLAWRGPGLAALTEQTASGPRPVADREAAAALVNASLLVPRDRLPAPDADEFYLADLVGLAARAGSAPASAGHRRPRPGPHPPHRRAAPCPARPPPACRRPSGACRSRNRGCCARRATTRRRSAPSLRD